MKVKTLLALTAAALLVPAGLNAQTTNVLSPAQSQLRELVQKVNAKIKDEKTTEADFADEIKSFDSLIAGAKDKDKEDAAQMCYMKGMLYLEVLKDMDKGAETFKQLKADFPDTRFGKGADKVLAGIEKQTASKKIQDGLVAGAVFPDFAEKDLSGNPISVAALKGKVVLVDFWATWCGPCRAELPNVIATYKKFHGQGFEIIGVSLDSDRDSLNTFLKEQEGMTWAQFFDGQGWNNALAVKYGVESIPFTVLIGPDGKIIHTDLRGEALEAAVGAALAKK
jgi:thiol-disulfide isomerase/thioredoxin